MKTKEEIHSRIRTIFAETFDFSEDQINLETNLISDLDLDSLDAIDLAGNLASEIDIRITESDLLSIRTIEDIVELLYKELNQ